MENLELRKSGMGELGNKDLSGKVIDAAIAVHRALGPGFIESVYENALCVELRRRGVGYERQKVINVLYTDVEVGEHRLDLLIEGKLVVELKAVRAVDDIFCDRAFLYEGGGSRRRFAPQFCCDATNRETHRSGMASHFLIS
ncbi:MAG TPA: GxxExxY protein [Candidatus Didemnitutus sp.]|nr:GxxExxY protein [Candidatus Didemnitutus sp.]